MKLYSDTLAESDLRAALPTDVRIDYLRPIRTRKRAHGWEISLEGVGRRHTRHKNSGGYGAVVDGSYAATWDDHGVWMARLYEQDPDALIAWYTGISHFYAATENEMRWRGRRGARGKATAPWLYENVSDIVWPPESVAA